MIATEKLDALFHRWQEEFPEYKGKFNKDGINNEEVFEKQKLKLLFLAKEPNDPDQSEWDFREWWAEEVKYSFSHRICEWAFGLLNGFPPVENITYDNEKRVQIMSAVAFMNLKKSGGKANADHDEIKKTITRERHLILEEISIINPHIIIGGLGRTEFWSLLFPDIRFTDSGFDIKVARHDSYRIIDYYHPSYRVPRSMSYCLLGRVFTSDVFREL